jgi:hypothetical protein
MVCGRRAVSRPGGSPPRNPWRPVMRLRESLVVVALWPSLACRAADLTAPPPPAFAAPENSTGTDHDEHEHPAHRDLQVLLVMSWDHPGAEGELRRMEAVGGVFEQLRADGWKVGVQESDNLRIVSRDQVGELVSRLDLTTYPAVVALHEGRVVRSFSHGCSTPLDRPGDIRLDADRRARARVDSPRPVGPDHCRVDGNLPAARTSLVDQWRHDPQPGTGVAPSGGTESPVADSRRLGFANVVAGGTEVATRRPARTTPSARTRVDVTQSSELHSRSDRRRLQAWPGSATATILTRGELSREQI